MNFLLLLQILAQEEEVQMTKPERDERKRNENEERSVFVFVWLLPTIIQPVSDFHHMKQYIVIQETKILLAIWTKHVSLKLKWLRPEKFLLEMKFYKT